MRAMALVVQYFLRQQKKKQTTSGRAIQGLAALLFFFCRGRWRFRTNCRQSPLLLSLMGCIGEKSRMAVVCLECCRFEIDLLIAKILEI